MAHDPSQPLKGERLLSLDIFRGLIMFLLIGEWTHIYDILVCPELQGTWISAFGSQFHHHPWNGMMFWDLVQPFFMFIVGVAIPYSAAKRREKGDSDSRILWHVVRRSLILLVLGWALYCIEPGRITFRFQNVLAQLAVTYLVAFLMMKRPFTVQFVFTLVVLAATDLLYRFFPVPGFDQPFVPDRNFGAWFDLLISGELSDGHWVSFNAIPTIAHTVWGVMVGQWLMGNRQPGRKIGILVLAGIVGVGVGCALSPVIPIIKRVSTASFVVVSGGICMLAMALLYGIVDIWKWRRGTNFFTVVGMNSIFIYLFAHSGGGEMANNIVRPFAYGLFSWSGKVSAEIAAALMSWGLLWSICWWLYKRKLFIKI